jgi:PHD/YefM family antitoxin component YafN of YafNO toxin-antitoxin module
MIDLKDGIDSLTNFKRDTARIVQQLQRTGHPLVLTINGKAEVVVQDAAAYQRMRTMAARAEREAALQGLREGLADIDAGRTKPAKAMLKRLARKHGFTVPADK